MRRYPMFRPALTVALALVIIVESGLTGLGAARAQTVGNTIVDPPSRVGRMSRLLGTVSFRAAGETDWHQAAMNYPVTSGDAFWTEPSSAAEIDMGQAHLALDQSTEFDIGVLDERSLQATQPQGAMFLRVRAMAADDVYRIATPRGAVVIVAPGAYEIVAGDAEHATTVTVVVGAARIDSTNASLTLAAGQTGRIDGASSFAVSVVPAKTDAFLAARLADERRVARPVLASRVAPPAVVAAMTGGDELRVVGDWADSPRYGAIWYPPVEKTWVPYRNGHWGYVAPWGWTWIDDASWGFAPSHYGRWVQDGPRWGWIPAERGGRERQREAPVYAPALVSFISIGIGVSVAAGSDRRLGEGRGSVGWVPLGPREAYVPPYRTSDRYVKAVNVGNVTNVTTNNTVTNVNNVTTITNLVNRDAATVVPVTAMTGSQPVAARVEAVTPKALAEARSERATAVRPTIGTSGVTPVMAKTLQLAPPATPVPVLPPAPGPVIAPVATAPAATVQSPVVKRLDPAPGAAAVRPEPVAAVPVAVALPSLRAPASVAPAHPQAGGTAAGASPAALPPGPVVVSPQDPVKPVSPVPAVQAAPAVVVKPVEPARVAPPPAPALAVPPAVVVKPAEPARAASSPAPAMAVPPAPVVKPAEPPRAAAPPAPALAVPPGPVGKPADPARPPPPPAPALAVPPGPVVKPVEPPRAAAPPAPALAVPPGPLVKPAEPARPAPRPAPALAVPPAVVVKPAEPPRASPPPPPALAVPPAPLVKPAEAPRAAPPAPPVSTAVVPPASVVKPVEPAKPTPPHASGKPVEGQ